jgi:alpha-tubulin suppressor-like RCC1 family protein
MCRVVTAICGAEAAACVVTSDGDVRCWGLATGVGDGTTTDHVAPTKNTAGPALDVACGGQRACARRADGSVLCWGGPFTGDGSLGGGDTPTVVPALAGATALAMARDHACAVVAGGALVCWGFDREFELGAMAPQVCSYQQMTAGCAPAPIAANVHDVIGVAAGIRHTCALHTNGDVECWGANDSGQLGDASQSARLPNGVAVLHGAAQIAAGGETTCARMNDATVRCWGDGTFGQLGAPAAPGGPCAACASTPQAVPGVRAVTQLAMGYDHVCALLQDGSLTCWGFADDGELAGAPTTMCGAFACAMSPETIPGVSGVTAIALGSASTYARLGDGTLVGFGANLHGQLGDGTEMNRSTPTRPMW